MRVVFTSFGATRRRPSRSEQIVAFLIRWAILCVAVWVAAWLIGGIHLDGWGSTLIVGLILGLLNAFLKPVLVMVALPITILTLGLFLLIINTGLLALTAWIAGKFDDINFAIDGFWDAFFGALIISVVGWLLGSVVNPGRAARGVWR